MATVVATSPQYSIVRMLPILFELQMGEYDISLCGLSEVIKSDQ
jgi:hypothetical protein